MYTFCFYFLLFLSYSFLGWFVETIWCYLHDKKISNRGFLIGPYCPIYGCSALLMILALKQYINDTIVLFLLATILTTFMEYITSYIMEKTFKARWWDYSNQPFNINGRICLLNSLMFGIGGFILLYYINPFYENLLYKIPYTTMIVLSISLAILFLVDFIISYKTIYSIQQKASLIIKDSTTEISKRVRENLEKQKILTRRLIHAFPNANFVPKIKVKKNTK